MQDLVRKLSAQSARNCFSGIRAEETLRKVRDALRAFDEPQLRIQDYEEAARLSNICRARGIAGWAIDFLICAVAHLRNWEVFATDRDLSATARFYR